MAKNGYIGIDSTAKKIGKYYIGDENGVARKITKAYIGDENGKARLCYVAHEHAFLTFVQYGGTTDDTYHYPIYQCSCGERGSGAAEKHSYSVNGITAQPYNDALHSFANAKCVCGRKTTVYRIHNYYDPVVVEATCTKGGKKTQTCKYCGYVETMETYAALGHTSSLTPCSTTVKCSRCGQTVNGTMHTWSGNRCTVCGVTKV